MEFFSQANNIKRRRKLPTFSHVAITVLIEFKNKAQDPVNGYPSIKAAIDGLVTARLFPDDTGEHIDRIIFEAPQTTGRDLVTLYVEAWE